MAKVSSLETEIKVWHARNEVFGETSFAVLSRNFDVHRKLFEGDGYILAAQYYVDKVEHDDEIVNELGEIFHRTQNLDEPWVAPHHHMRSTSMGDIMTVRNGSQPAEMWVVDAVGFIRLSGKPKE